MGKDSVVEFRKPGTIEDPLTELLRGGARQLIEQAIEAELAELLGRYAGRVDDQGRRAVVRNGYLPERVILTGVGPVSVKVPKVRSRTGEAVVFRSALVPPYVRKARRVEAALPWLYLKGVATGQMQAALEVLVGEEAKGLSAAVIGRLKRAWEAEYAAWRQRDVGRDRWVYLWADGIYSGLRADHQKLCVLVIIGVDERGEKHFLAIEDGVRESTQSWREVLLDLKKRGLAVPPKLAVGDGALGFWSALEEVYPETRHQRCWVHKTANVLNYLPKGCSRRRSGPCRRSGWPRAGPRHSGPSITSRGSIGPSTPRRWPAWRRTERPCWPSTTSRPSTGCTSGRRTRSNRPLPPFATARTGPRAV